MGKAQYPEDPAQDLLHNLYLGNLEEGKYELYLEGIFLEPLFVLPKEERNRPLGVIELHHTPHSVNPDLPEVPDDYRFIEIGQDPANPLSNPTGITYHLHFKSRMTFRRYIFEDREVDLPIPQALSLVYGGAEIEGTKMPDPELSSIDRELEIKEPGNLIKEKFISRIYV